MTYECFISIIKSDVFKRNIHILYKLKEVDINENDIPTKEKIQSESSWIQSKNEYCWWKKSFSSQKSKRKKSIISLGRIYVAFSSIQNMFDTYVQNMGDER